jgi:hypothetical protein
MVFVYLRNLPYLFFQTCQVTPCLKGNFARNTTHYLFPQYLESQRAKKNIYSEIILCTHVQFTFRYEYTRKYINIKNKHPAVNIYKSIVNNISSTDKPTKIE